MTNTKIQGGIALWRQIADAIRLDIVGGKLVAGDRLPTESALSERFGANRHTVRRALAALAAENIVAAEQGRGTFVRNTRRISYPIGKRTRMRENLRHQAETISSIVLDHEVVTGPPAVTEALHLPPGTRLVRMETRTLADGVPLTRSTTFVCYDRFPDFAERNAQHQSITAVLASYGVADYSRGSTRISARQADVSEAHDLHLAPGAVVLVSEAVDVDTSGEPISYLLSRFPAERIELVV